MPPDIASLLNNPLVLLAAVALMVVGPKVLPALAPLASLLAGLLARLAPKPSPAPVDPQPSPVPPSVPMPGPTGRPLIDWALQLIARLAARRFPDLDPEEALERYLVEEAHRGYVLVEAKAEAEKK